MLNRLIQNPAFIQEVTRLCPAVNGLSEIIYNGAPVIRIDSSQPLPKNLRTTQPIPVQVDAETIPTTFVYSGELQLE